MKAGTRRRAEAIDRRMAAIHEAGHVVIARHLGIVAPSASIFPTGTRNEWEKQWVGKASFYRYVIIGKRKQRVEPAPERAQQMLGVAGAVAEFCWQGESARDIEETECWHDPDVMSGTDWEGTGCAPGEPTRQLFRAIDRVFSLFDRETGKLFPHVTREARRLIEESR